MIPENTSRKQPIAMLPGFCMQKDRKHTDMETNVK